MSPLDGETCGCTSDVLHSKRVKRGEKKGMRESVRERERKGRDREEEIERGDKEKGKR